MTGWSIDHKINVGHIVSTVVAIIAAVGWMYNIDSRARTNEEQIEKLTRAIAIHSQQSAHHGVAGDIKELRAEIRALHTLIERMDGRLKQQWDEINRRRSP